MRVLVDTHAFFWWLKGDRRLSATALRAIDDAGNEVLISAVIPWELATKTRIGKWPEGRSVVEDLDLLIEQRGLQALPISLAHARRAGLLPGNHRDPFDRLLAAQSELEGAPLVTADPAFSSFGVVILW